jgi:hypothetical protein
MADRQSIHLLLTLSLAGLLAGAGLCSAAPKDADAGRPEPIVAIERHASLADSLAALHRSAGVPVLCEKPRVDRRLETALSDAPLPAALAEVSRSFHLYWVRRERSLVFHRRYADERERPDIEVELLTAITRDVLRLLSPFAPGPLDAQETRDHNRFYTSLTPEQREQARTMGLPLRALGPQQQALWRTINRRQAYSNSWMEARRSAQLYEGWKRSRLEYDTGSRGQLVLKFRYPDPVESGNLGVPLSSSTGLPQIRVLPGGENRPTASARPPSGWDARVQLPAGETTARKLAEALSAASGKPFELDSYAAERKILAYVGAARVRDVVQALEDLYGWTATPRAKGGWRLGRVAPPAATDHVALHAALRACMPPAIYHLWSNKEGDWAYTARLQYHRDVLLARLNAAKPNWKSFEVREMDAETQVVLANLICDYQVRPSIRYVTNKPEAYAWLAREDEGFFGIDEPSLPGAKPLLWFGVRRPDGKVDSWGWAVGSSSP